MQPLDPRCRQLSGWCYQSQRSSENSWYWREGIKWEMLDKRQKWKIQVKISVDICIFRLWNWERDNVQNDRFWNHLWIKGSWSPGFWWSYSAREVGCEGRKHDVWILSTTTLCGVSGRAHEGPCRVARKLEGRSGIHHLTETREETVKCGYQHQTPGNSGKWTMDDTPSVWPRGRHRDSGRSDQQQPTAEAASEGMMNRGVGKQTRHTSSCSASAAWGRRRCSL